MKIKSVKSLGFHPTYTLNIDHPVHNYLLSNNIVSKNSHAYSYGMITYITAYLKSNYPIEYMCSIMICEANNQDDIIKCISECKRLAIKVSPPNINKSLQSFSIADGQTISFGLAPVKNLGEKPVALIVEERQRSGDFTSLRDFCERVDLSQINKLKLESLIRAGAFDQFGDTRASMLANVETIWTYKDQLKSYLSKTATYEKRLKAYQDREEKIALYNQAEKEDRPTKKPATIKKPTKPDAPAWPELIKLGELPESEILNAEYELLGFYISSHPLNKYLNEGALRLFNTIEDIKEIPHNTTVTIGAVITNIQEITIAKNKQRMAFLKLEDLTGSIESACFSKMYEANKHLINKGQPLGFRGQVQVTELDDNKIVKLKLDQIFLLKEEKINPIPILKVEELINILSTNTNTSVSTDIELILKAQDGTIFKLPSIKINKIRDSLIGELKRLR